MHWKPECLSYDICIPPLKKNICEVSHEETEAYYLWFMSVIPERIAYLSKTCATQLKCDPSKMDLSPDSLQILWRWFLQVAKTEVVPINPNKYNYRVEKQLTLQTEYILRDIGMYLGETFIVNHKSLYWGYYETPLSDAFVNRPVILGFEDHNYSPPFKAIFEPINMVRVQALRAMEKPAEDNRLIELYRKWEGYCVD